MKISVVKDVFGKLGAVLDGKDLAEIATQGVIDTQLSLFDVPVVDYTAYALLVGVMVWSFIVVPISQRKFFVSMKLRIYFIAMRLMWWK